MAKISDDVTKGVSKSAARAMLRAVGLTVSYTHLRAHET